MINVLWNKTFTILAEAQFGDVTYYYCNLIKIKQVKLSGDIIIKYIWHNNMIATLQVSFYNMHRGYSRKSTIL